MDWTDDSDRADRDALLGEIEKWRNDWASRNTDAYLAHYAGDFSTGSANFAAFSDQKRLVNSGKTWIKVSISKVSVFPYPSQPGLVVVNFEQDYDSNNLSNRMIKRQYWIKRNDKWQIVYEGSA
jgi:histidinol-phosphate/aromatic aminotransferase/cobyric acid decarboxylase-like protein